MGIWNVDNRMSGFGFGMWNGGFRAWMRDLAVMY